MRYTFLEYERNIIMKDLTPKAPKALSYTSKPFVKGPDFMSKFSGNVYDVTTRGTQWGANHFNRGYDGALKLTDYVRPTGFKF